MNIKLELLKEHISDIMGILLEDMSVNMSKIANTSAIMILDEIKSVICNDKLSDFEVVEEIVCILEKNNIDCGGRHDF